MFTGPNFPVREPSQCENSIPSNYHELGKTISLSATNRFIINDIIERLSSFNRILRIISHIFRVFNESSVKVHLPYKGLENTFIKIIATIHQQCFKNDIDCLKNTKPITPALQKLAPFLHKIKKESTVVHLRVGGWLNLYDAKFPALFPEDHPFTSYYVDFLHRSNLHAGPKATSEDLGYKC